MAANTLPLHCGPWPASEAPGQDLGTEENCVAFSPVNNESVGFNKRVDSGESLRCHVAPAFIMLDWASDSQKASQTVGGTARI